MEEFFRAQLQSTTTQPNDHEKSVGNSQSHDRQFHTVNNSYTNSPPQHDHHSHHMMQRPKNHETDVYSFQQGTPPHQRPQSYYDGMVNGAQSVPLQQFNSSRNSQDNFFSHQSTNNPSIYATHQAPNPDIYARSTGTAPSQGYVAQSIGHQNLHGHNPASELHHFEAQQQNFYNNNRVPQEGFDGHAFQGVTYRQQGFQSRPGVPPQSTALGQSSPPPPPIQIHVSQPGISDHVMASTEAYLMSSQPKMSPVGSPLQHYAQEARKYAGAHKMYPQANVAASAPASPSHPVNGHRVGQPIAYRYVGANGIALQQQQQQEQQVQRAPMYQQPPQHFASPPSVGQPKANGSSIQRIDQTGGWTFPPSADVRVVLDSLFAIADMSGTGRLEGRTAVDFLSKSGLARETLREVWAIAATNTASYLGREQFQVAMRLISMAQAGIEISHQSLVSRSQVGLPLPRFPFDVYQQAQAQPFTHIISPQLQTSAVGTPKSEEGNGSFHGLMSSFFPGAHSISSSPALDRSRSAPSPGSPAVVPGEGSSSVQPPPNQEFKHFFASPVAMDPSNMRRTTSEGSPQVPSTSKAEAIDFDADFGDFQAFGSNAATAQPMVIPEDVFQSFAGLEVSPSPSVLSENGNNQTFRPTSTVDEDPFLSLNSASDVPLERLPIFPSVHSSNTSGVSTPLSNTSPARPQASPVASDTMNAHAADASLDFGDFSTAHSETSNTAQLFQPSVSVPSTLHQPSGSVPTALHQQSVSTSSTPQQPSASIPSTLQQPVEELGDDEWADFTSATDFSGPFASAAYHPSQSLSTVSPPPSSTRETSEDLFAVALPDQQKQQPLEFSKPSQFSPITGARADAAVPESTPTTEHDLFSFSPTHQQATPFNETSTASSPPPPPSPTIEKKESDPFGEIAGDIQPSADLPPLPMGFGGPETPPFGSVGSHSEPSAKKVPLDLESIKRLFNPAGTSDSLQSQDAIVNESASDFHAPSAVATGHEEGAADQENDDWGDFVDGSTSFAAASLPTAFDISEEKTSTLGGTLHESAAFETSNTAEISLFDVRFSPKPLDTSTEVAKEQSASGVVEEDDWAEFQEATMDPVTTANVKDPWALLSPKQQLSDKETLDLHLADSLLVNPEIGRSLALSEEQEELDKAHTEALQDAVPLDAFGDIEKVEKAEKPPAKLLKDVFESFVLEKLISEERFEEAMDCQEFISHLFSDSTLAPKRHEAFERIVRASDGGYVDNSVLLANFLRDEHFSEEWQRVSTWTSEPPASHQTTGELAQDLTEHMRLQVGEDDHNANEQILQRYEQMFASADILKTAKSDLPGACRLYRMAQRSHRLIKALDKRRKTTLTSWMSVLERIEDWLNQCRALLQSLSAASASREVVAEVASSLQMSKFLRSLTQMMNVASYIAVSIQDALIEWPPKDLQREEEDSFAFVETAETSKRALKERKDPVEGVLKGWDDLVRTAEELGCESDLLSCLPMEDIRHICLTAPPDAGLCSLTFVPLTMEPSTVYFCGQPYLASSVNFWVNCVSQSPPPTSDAW